jgi:hypothetical protein
MTESVEVEELIAEIEALDQLLFEARARHQVREYLESGWITPEHATNVLSLLGEPCL